MMNIEEDPQIGCADFEASITYPAIAGRTKLFQDKPAGSLKKAVVAIEHLGTIYANLP